MPLQSFRQRLVDSAIEVALEAFWVAVWGAVLTGGGILYVSIAGAPFYWLTALGGGCIAFAVVVVATGTLVLFRRGGHGVPLRVGRKGFMDYKIQSLRALNRLAGELVGITSEMTRIGGQVDSDTKRVHKAQRGWRGSDERAYGATLRAARRIEKRAAVMRIHSDKFAEDARLFTEGAEKWFDWVLTAVTTDAERREISQVATLLEGLHGSVCGTLSSMEVLRQSVEGPRNMSEQLDIACGALLEAVNIVIDSTRSIKVFCEIQATRLRGIGLTPAGGSPDR